MSNPQPTGPRRARVSAAALIVTLLAAGCTEDTGDTTGGDAAASPSSASAPPETSAPTPAAVTRAPKGVSLAEGTSPGVLLASVSAALFESAPVVVVAPVGERDAVMAATKAATSLGVPLLLDDAPPATPSTTTGPSATPPETASSSPDDGVVSGEIERLGAEAVLAVGDGLDSLSSRLADLDVVMAAATDGDVDQAMSDLPTTGRPDPLSETTVLLRAGSTRSDVPEQDAVAILAARATGTAAGAIVISSATADPRATSASVKAMKDAPTGSVLAVGAGFGPVDRLSDRLDVAATGVQLPGGGQKMFPGRALVALYGHPGGGALGVLGEQGPAASVARAKKVAKAYDAVYDVPVVPTFEVIATVASGSAGKDKNYSNEWSVSSLKPYVDAATEAGMYVVLDLQPGRADLVTQAKAYRSLLVHPNVGLAIDPEWALTAQQKPLQQIGSVSAGQVNAVVTWLADLTAAEKLPQKLLVLHQFKTSMIRDEKSIDTSRDELAVLIHADGQGGRSAKEGTWNTLVASAPKGVYFGWKNFYDEDPQLATPAQSVQRTPEPLMISYQ